MPEEAKELERTHMATTKQAWRVYLGVSPDVERAPAMESSTGTAACSSLGGCPSRRTTILLDLPGADFQAEPVIELGELDFPQQGRCMRRLEHRC